MADSDDGYEKLVVEGERNRKSSEFSLENTAVLPTDTDSESDQVSVGFDLVWKHHPNGAAQVHDYEEACWDKLSDGADQTEDPGNASNEKQVPLLVPKQLRCLDGNKLRNVNTMNR